MGFSIKGLEGVNAQLNAIEAELAVKVLRQAMRVVFKPVLDAAKANTPVWSGALRDSLVISSPSVTGGGDLVAVVGIKVGQGKGARQAMLAAAAFGEGQSKELPPARRWHFIELGTIHVAAHPYLRPALDSNAQAVIDGLKDAVAAKIEAAVRKASRGK